MSQVTCASIEAALAAYVDPQLEADLVAAGCVRAVEIDEAAGSASVEIVLPYPSDGTRVEDVVRYELPLQPLGEIAHPLVRRQLDAIFRYRTSVLAERFAWQTVAAAVVLGVVGTFGVLQLKAEFSVTDFVPRPNPLLPNVFFDPSRETPSDAKGYIP